MESSKNFDLPPVLKVDVEKRLMRVFAFLRQHDRKAKLSKKLAEAKDTSDASPTVEQPQQPETDQEALTRELTCDGSNEEPRAEPTAIVKTSRKVELEAEVEELRREIKFKDFDTSGVITASDLNSALRSLHRNPSKAEIQWMIWEVDDDLDGCIDWDEFRGAYARCAVDRLGTEPCKFFHLIQFLLSDPDGGGFVSVADVVTELARVPGAERTTSRIKRAFGAMNEQQENQRHSLSEYLHAVLTDLPAGFFSIPSTHQKQ